MPYTPILNIAHILQSTLYIVEHTDYPHKGSPALEHVKRSLRDALEAIYEVEQLQAEIAGKPITIVPPEPLPIDPAHLPSQDTPRNKRP